MAANLRWITLAEKEAAKYGRHKQHLMGAVIVRGGSVLSKAANLSRPWGKLNCGRHAEERALVPTRDFSGGKIYVARIGMRMSKPCKRCLSKIKLAGLTHMVYLNWDKQIIEERV